MIKVLIVDDSKTLSQFIEFILNEDSGIEVIGKVENGKQAVEFVNRNKPDIITMDIDMPVMNGLEATRIIMSTIPIPIIVVTASRNARDHHIPMEALAAGALTVLEKPRGFSNPGAEERTAKLIKMVKLYSQIKVVKRRYQPKETPKISSLANEGKYSSIPTAGELKNKKYIAIGISTGGPEVLKRLVKELSVDFPLPVLIVQHITAGFLEGMVTWLDGLSDIKVKIASDNEVLKPGIVYFAPDKFQMGVRSNYIVLEKAEAKTIICPSVKYLFSSLAKNNAKDTIAMLLTGMGSDGSMELKQLKDAGAITIAQDKKSALIHGMPGEAIKLGGAGYVLNIDQIIEVLLSIAKN